MVDAPETGSPESPARTFPVPTSVSPEAQQFLSMPAFGSAEYPELDDVPGWVAYVEQADAGLLMAMELRNAGANVTVAELSVDGVPVFDVTPEGAPNGADDPIYYDIHGGALVMGAGPGCRAMAIGNAAGTRMHTLAVDYRMPPRHPYPAALDDCLVVYRSLLEDHAPETIVVGGGSAGGNLAAALMLRARDEGLPMPAALVLMTPEVDLTESGDSFQTNLGVDAVLTRSLMPANLLYAGGHDLTDPYVSPLFGDFTADFPPTFLQSGTRDLFLSNTVRMHRKLRAAGVDAELHVFEAMPHGGFFGAPEDRESSEEVRRFIAAHLKP
ncbi:MAG: esterase/lipase/thioesterase [Actinomycetia bacterium]|nr:esterase/lipase/thioesterase [Actinomycetes bacterium]